MTTENETVSRIIIRGDGSFSRDPNGDWVSARHYDAALAEIARLQQLIRVADDVSNKAAAEIQRLQQICADGVVQIDSNVAEIGRLRADIESLKQYTGVYSSGWRSPYARPADTRRDES